MKGEIIKQRSLTVVVGLRHKTDVLVDFVPQWIENNPKGNLIIFDPQCAITDHYRNKTDFTFDHTEDFRWIDDMLKNKDTVFGKNGALLVLNMGHLLFPKRKDMPLKMRPPMHPKFLHLLSLARVLDLDIIISFGELDYMPLRLEWYITHFIVLPTWWDGRTIDKESCVHDVLETAILTMNKYHVEYGVNPKKEYLVVNVEKGEMIAPKSIQKRKFKKVVKSLGLKKKVQYSPSK